MKLCLAPLHGVTNRVFRKAWFAHFGGIDAAYAPFILSVTTARMKETHFKDLAPDPDVRVPLVPQILGNDAEEFLSTAKIIAGLGYGEVNWNLGCPYPMVAKKKRGSGLLPYPDRIRGFLDAVCPRLEIALSVKLRLGLADPSEILDLMPIFNEYPIRCVVIHPRIGKQMYRGTVNLEGFAEAASLSAHPVMYNGDIRDRTGFASLASRFPGIDQWMIGRGAISDPFLPGKIRGLDPASDPLGAVSDFHDDLYGAYRSVLCGPAHVLDKMKEVWSYLAPSIGGIRFALEDVGQSRTLAAYERNVHVIFSEGEWKGNRA